MIYMQRYDSPLGEMLLECSEDAVIACGFSDSERYREVLDKVNSIFSSNGKKPEIREESHPLLAEAKRWLDTYFEGREPDFMPPVHITGAAFRKNTLSIVENIPYGTTTTYGKIALRLAANTGRGKTSSQAVGGAISRNPVSIIVPCHRVVGWNGDLVGYAGGLERKARLLELEGIEW